ncbi:MAG: sensor histidine kinase [Crocinitomicaceae bacterium]
MKTLVKIFDLNPSKFGEADLDRLYYLSGVFFLIGGALIFSEGLFTVFSEHLVIAIFHLISGFMLFTLVFIRSKKTVRWLIHIGFLIAGTQMYYYNIYYGMGSGNYIFYVAFVLAASFFFYNSHSWDLVVDLMISIVSFLMSVYGPFVVDQASVSEESIRNLFTYNIVSGVLIVFIIQIYFLKLLLSSRKEVENKIKEKEVLLSEVNHRVRNNLNVISSLLKLQKDSLKSKEAINAINQSALRVHSMAWVHNHLYKNTEVGEIDFKEYIEQLVKEIRYSTGIEKEIHLVLKVDPVRLDVSKAIPLGQIINELITNSIKHAFNGVINPEISVTIVQFRDEIELIYLDNGKGYDRTEVSLESLGLFLINSLGEQLEGRSAFQTSGKFEYHLRIENVSV